MTKSQQQLIKKLLALAENQGATRGERDAAQAKAMELMAAMLAGRPIPC
jgi:hypothetical protein